MSPSPSQWKPEAPKLQQQDLAGKVAIVTGATKGIGRAITLSLATRGASILGTYSGPTSAHHFDTLAHTVTSLYEAAPDTTPPKLIGIVANILSFDCASTITSALGKHFDGKLDILVFNAAVMKLGKVGELEVEDVSEALRGNVQTPIMVVEGLVRMGAFRRDSRVVTISSESARVRRGAGGSVYSATKAALESLTRSWADELGKRPGMDGTTANSICVGFTKTEAYGNISEDVRKALTESDMKEVTVGDRIAESEDIADIVGLIVSEKARWISGSVVSATGGKVKIL